MKNMICKLSALSIIICAPAVYAHEELSPFYFGASAGYSVVSGMEDGTGGNITGRLTLGAEGWETGEAIWGIEVGAQSGNDYLRPEASVEDTGHLGAVIEASLEPLADLLITVRTETDEDQPWGIFLKGGAAYRELRLTDRTSEQDNIQRIAPELQAGVSYQVSRHARVIAYYQGIYSENNVGLGRDDDENTTIDDIPTQQAGFLGIEYRL